MGYIVMFQFLIGRLATMSVHAGFCRCSNRFQFLIGRLATMGEIEDSMEGIMSFNSS